MLDIIWQILRNKLSDTQDIVSEIEDINHELYDKLDKIKVEWKVSEDKKIIGLVPKKIIPFPYYGRYSIINNTEMIISNNTMNYKYNISDNSLTEIGNLGVGVWRQKETNYILFNEGTGKIDIYDSSFVFQSTINCDFRPLFGAWIDTHYFFLKGKDYKNNVGCRDIPSKRGICINGNIEEWTTTLQSTTKFSNYPILWKRDNYTLINMPFMKEGFCKKVVGGNLVTRMLTNLFIIGNNNYYINSFLISDFQKNLGYPTRLYWDFYIGDSVFVTISDPYEGGVLIESV